MKSNLYKITVEYQKDSKGSDVEVAPLVFEAHNKEDIFKIIEMMKSKIDLNEADTAAFGVGLKLMGGVLMNNKESEVTKRLMPHFKNLMKELKGK